MISLANLCNFVLPNKRTVCFYGLFYKPLDRSLHSLKSSQRKTF